MIKIHSFEAERHNNPNGNAFVLVRFTYSDKENGLLKHVPLTAVVFDDKLGDCAVFNPDNLEDKYRGGFFESKLRRFIEAWDAAQSATLKKVG